MATVKKRSTIRRIGLAILALIVVFGLWSLVTLPRGFALYGDSARPVAGAGDVMPVSTGVDGDWASTGRDPGGSQYSPLDQIDARNVGQLQVAWTHHSGDYKPGDIYTGTRLEQTPLIVDRTLYYCTPFERVFALDAATGAQKWVFDPYRGEGGKPPLFKGEMKQKHCRGVAYWRDAEAAADSPCAARIYRSAGPMAIVALDARTGRPCPGFGAAARHPGYVTHADFDAKGEGPVPASSPPIVVGDILVAAAGARDVFVDAADGIVRGFDARDGTLRWEFDPIPEEYVHKTGAANIWTLLSADPVRKLVFLATTSPSADYYGGSRQFDIPLANSVVAVSTETGKVAWHYQVIRHDVFDYDLPAHPMLVTIRKDGRPRDVVIMPTKQGLIFILDRDTGKPVFPVREYRQPGSRVPGERLPASQPVPVLPEPLNRNRLTRADMFGITPLDRAWCRARFDKLRYDGLFTPPDPQESLIYPSSMGGANWGGAAYDPVTNLLIVKSENLANTQFMRPMVAGQEASKSFMNRQIPGTRLETGGVFFLSPLGIPCTPPPWGTIMAYDMNSGKLVWRVPMGQSHRFGITVPSALDWGSPSVGGPIVTGGGLVFIGATLDSKFRALDVRTGRELWQSKLPFPGMAVPATYAVGGRQYVAIAAGGNAYAETRIGDALVVYALPKK
ncbi:MAG: pyrroloquinoline quinone-dependent dehydrogenase [Sphingobium sp.]